MENTVRIPSAHQSDVTFHPPHPFIVGELCGQSSDGSNLGPRQPRASRGQYVADGLSKFVVGHRNGVLARLVPIRASALRARPRLLVAAPSGYPFVATTIAAIAHDCDGDPRNWSSPKHIHSCVQDNTVASFCNGDKIYIVPNRLDRPERLSRRTARPIVRALLESNPFRASCRVTSVATSPILKAPGRPSPGLHGMGRRSQCQRRDGAGPV